MTTRYTAVMHSAGVMGDSRFAEAVEECAVTTGSQVHHVLAAGGILFDSYTAASDFCEWENYPPGVEGLIPHAPGTFSRRGIMGASIYMPGRRIFTAILPCLGCGDDWVHAKHHHPRHPGL